MSQDYALESFINREENRLLDKELERFDREQEGSYPVRDEKVGMYRDSETGRFLFRIVTVRYA